MNIETKHALYYSLLTRKLIVLVIAVSFTPMILVISIILSQFHNSYHEKVNAHLGELVMKHKQNIDSFLQEKLNDIHFMVNSFSFEELSNEVFLQDKLAALQYDYQHVFVDLGVINEHGRQIAYAGPYKLEDVRYSNAKWFKKAIENQYYISNVFLGFRGYPHFIITVRKKIGEIYWILRSTIDFGAFNSLVQNLSVGKTGFAFIINKEGKLQTKSVLDFHPDKKFYSYFLQNKKKADDGIAIVEKDDKSSGRKYIYVTALLKNKWLLIFRQETSDAFADLNRTQRIAIIIFLLGGLGIIATTFFVSKMMVSRIARADNEKDLMNQQVIETGKLASIGELAAGIAHEINNPVAIMVEEAGWIQDLLEEEDLKESENLDEFNRALKQINTQGKRCKEITHKLLSFARKTDSIENDVQINELIEDVISLLEQRAKYDNIAIIANLANDIPMMRMSSTELQQVFLNLINNALDAMDKNGGIINISTRYLAGNIIIDIADDGPGIPEVNLAKIFDPFFTTKPVGKGTGLGLSICYGIVNKSGGKIEAKSLVEKGTTFTITIPVIKKQDK